MLDAVEAECVGEDIFQLRVFRKGQARKGMNLTAADAVKTAESRSADVLDCGRNHECLDLCTPFEQLVTDLFKPLAENNSLDIHIILENSTGIIAQIDTAANFLQTIAECHGFQRLNVIERTPADMRNRIRNHQLFKRSVSKSTITDGCQTAAE